MAVSSRGMCLQDLGNVHTAAAFLQKFELKFDLVSAVQELAKQLKLEFDFVREARIMDTIATQLNVMLVDHSVTQVGCKCPVNALHLHLA